MSGFNKAQVGVNSRP